MTAFQRVLSEIHRRSVWQVLLIYIGASWAVIEAVQGLTDATGLPEWFPSFAVGLLLIGFPIVVATAVIQGGEERRDGAAASRAGPPPEGVEARSAGGAGQAPAEVGGSGQASRAGTGPASLAGGTGSASLAAGTGSLDRPRSLPPAHRRLFTWRNAITGGVLAMALWGVLATGWILLGQPTGMARGGDDADGGGLTTVAVLPFENLSPDAENAFFAAGIHEDILTQLSKIGALVIISRTSVMNYADSDKSLRQIGDELGAGAVLEGSVRRAGDHVRITTQLIDSQSDAHLWAATYDRELTDVFRIQTEIATEVADALAATLSPEEEARISSPPTVNMEAYDLYLRGREFFNQYDPDGNRASIDWFKRAIDVDADLALAWAGLADAYAQGVYRYGYAAAMADSAVAAAETAVRLRPDLGEVHKALGAAYTNAGRREEADAAYLRAAELTPSDFRVLNNLGVEASTRGRMDDALVWYRRAARIAPTHPFPRTNSAEIYTLLGDFETADVWLRHAERDFPAEGTVFQQRAYWHLFQGDSEQAYESGLEGLQALPEDPGAHFLAGALALWAGRPAEAADHLTNGSDMAPRGGWMLHPSELLQAAALIDLGRPDEAAARIDNGVAFVQRLRDAGDPAGFIDYDLAAASALRGDTEAALGHFEDAVAAGARYAIHPEDPLFRSIREESRYQELLAEVAADMARMRASMEALERAEGIR